LKSHTVTCRRDDANLRNLHFVYGNINANAEQFMSSLPEGRVHMISMQFPDPWFKKRHHKRRMLQPKVVDVLAKYMPPGSRFFVQSDVLEVATQMRDVLCNHAAFEVTFPPVSPDTTPALTESGAEIRVDGMELWLDVNPLGVATEREKATFKKSGCNVYRVMFTRNDLLCHEWVDSDLEDSVVSSDW